MRKFNRVSLMPTGCKTDYPLCEGFPRDFTIDVSEDGLTWTSVYQAADYPTPTAVMQTFCFDTVCARYVRVYATALRPRPIDNNYYRMQLAEIEVELHAPTVDYDVDFNGEVELADALRMLYKMQSGSGKYSVNDAQGVLKYLAHT